MSRERLGVPRAVEEVLGGEKFDVVLLKCGHWFRVHRGTFAGEIAGCAGCDALERLVAMKAAS